MYSNYYRKPSIKNKEEDRVVTTEERLIEARRMCGALMTEEPREIIIYMKHVSPSEIEEFEKGQKVEKVEYKRYKEEGNESDRSFKGFRHNGEVYGITRALQALEIKSIGNTGISKVKATGRK